MLIQSGVLPQRTKSKLAFLTFLDSHLIQWEKFREANSMTMQFFMREYFSRSPDLVAIVKLILDLFSVVKVLASFHICSLLGLLEYV